MYNAKVLEIFKNPKNVGTLKGANGVGTVGNAACGDIMKMYLKISDDGIIEDAKFKTFGCAAAITTTSVATEIVKGKTIEEALKIKNSQIIEILGGLPTNKIHCSVLAEEAIKAAIDNYYKRKNKKSKNKDDDEEEENDEE
ncbi:MAG: iron-sulfur cluster assembly scaffold protein [Clostridia bacterium]|nr:iron-sulfur cluster assembly scaffold protein [Clostridia bacterium]